MASLKDVKTEDLIRELSSRYHRAYFVGEPNGDNPLENRRWHKGEAERVFLWASSMARQDWEAFERDANHLGVEVRDKS